MQIIPAIDIRHGEVVRLQQGDPEQEKRYDAPPAVVAQRFTEAGAGKIHIVDLDGAIDGTTDNELVISEIVQKCPVRTELGGGIRSLDSIRFWLDRGISQVILGTVAVQDPDLVGEAMQEFGPENIIIGIDVRNGDVATHGWQETSSIPAEEFGKLMTERGVGRFIYTAIETDGMMEGPAMDALRIFAEKTNAAVTASGGIRDIADLRALRALESVGIDSAIIGKAIYEGEIDLADAIQQMEGL